MAYIEPTSNLTICTGVPLTPSYIHTLTFTSRIDQSNYFNTKAKFRNIDFQYIRRNGRLKVPYTMGQLINCNYLFFNNSYFENHPIYCFITDIVYVNNATTEIVFEEDIFQTWYMDCQWTQCFVEREHAANDTIGINVTDEGLELGPYICENTIPITPFSVNVFGYVFASSYYATLTSSSPISYSLSKWEGQGQDSRQNLFNGICLNFAEDIAHAFAMADAFQNSEYSSSLLAIVAVPREVWKAAKASNGWVATYNQTIDKPYSNFAGTYTPVNKKLFTYPYKFMVATTNEGQEVTYRYELFAKTGTLDNMNFVYRALAQINFSILCTPSFYAGNNRENVAIVLGNWPQCGFVNDTYGLWYAQNQIKYPASITSTIISSAASIGVAVVGSKLGIPSALSAVAAEKITQLAEGGRFLEAGQAKSIAMAAMSDARSAANASIGESIISGAMTTGASILGSAFNNSAESKSQQIGSQNCVYTGSEDTAAVSGLKTIVFKEMCITPNMAQRIDSFFTRFGYKTNLVKVPELMSRRYFNYVKTSGANLIGSVPQYAIMALNSMFDNGITLWHDPNYIGNYTVNNSILGNG